MITMTENNNNLPGLRYRGAGEEVTEAMIQEMVKEATP